MRRAHRAKPVHHGARVATLRCSIPAGHKRADAPAPAAARTPAPAAGEPSRTSKEARWRRHRAPGKRSKGARPWFRTDPRSTKWLGIGSGGDSAAAAPGETAGASTASSARDSPAPVAAGPPAPAAKKSSRTTKEARWGRRRAPGWTRSMGGKNSAQHCNSARWQSLCELQRRERTSGGGRGSRRRRVDAEVHFGTAFSFRLAGERSALP